MVTIRLDGVRFGGVDDDRSIKPGLFLEAGMTVVPIGAALPDGKSGGKSLAWRDSGEADAGDAVQFIGQQNSMPMDRTGHGQLVVYA